MVCNTGNIVFCFFRVKKTRICLLFNSVKTFSATSCMHFAQNMLVSTHINKLWNSTLTRFLLIITIACMENKKKKRIKRK